jgi:hypothetical protein
MICRATAFIAVILISSGHALARWVSADPLFVQNPKKALESPLEANSFSYSLNAPTSFVDATGTVGESLIAKAITKLGRGSKRFLKHVNHGHVVGGGRSWGTKFVRGSKKRLEGLAQNVLKDHDPAHVVDQGNRVVLQRMFKNAQGTRGERVVRLVVDKSSGRLVTMFPSKNFLSISAGVASLAAAEGAQAAAASVPEELGEPGWSETIATAVAETLNPFAGSATSSADVETLLLRDALLGEAEKRTIFQVEAEEQRSLSAEERDDIGSMVSVGAVD